MNKRVIFRYCLALFFNVSPFLLGCLLYNIGYLVSISFLVFAFLLDILNYKWTTKITSFLFLNFIMLLSSSISCWLSTQLYYSNISSDPMTMVVGNIELIVLVAFILILTAITTALRAVKQKSNN